jgi:TPR repeat protein
MLLRGKGCSENKEQAFEWFKRSAEQNNYNAQFMLGLSPHNPFLSFSHHLLFR